MSLDTLDAAFVRRLALPPRAAQPAAAPPRPETPRQRVTTVSATPAPTVARRPEAPAPSDSDPMVERLLTLSPEQWDALAAHVEAARQRGRRVIAVAGARSGEGRTTLLRCLAATLRARGRDVACSLPHDLATIAAGPDGRGPTHDKRIVLVDAGIWFPPGPIRRAVLQVASLGCEAAILVRRAGAPGGPARQAALEALGIEVLGEVLTFTGPQAADDVRDGGVAA